MTWITKHYSMANQWHGIKALNITNVTFFMQYTKNILYEAINNCRDNLWL